VPVLVVQHLHPHLVDGFVGWMQRVSALPVVVAADGDRPQPGWSTSRPPAPTSSSLPLLARRSGRFGPRGSSRPAAGAWSSTRTRRGPHQPSADELFASVAAVRRRARPLGRRGILVVLPGAGLAEAMTLGERTRLAVAGAPVPLADQPLTVTTSVGVATGAGDGWEGLVRRADTGLYAAKEGGRDQVVAGPAAGSRSFTPEGQDAARYR
jgi:hypothetical protein